MKILQIMAGGEHGGAETAFVDMCLAMAEQKDRLDLEIVTRANDLRVAQLRAAGLTVHCLPFGGKFDFFTSFALHKIIKNFQPDIIQSWMCRAASFVPKWSPKISPKQYIHVTRLGSPYKTKYFKSCDAYVPITPDLKKYLIEQGVSANKMEMIVNFAEVPPAQNDIKRTDYDTPDDAFLLLGLGRLHDDKAFDTLIKAVACLPENFHLWIAGEGPLRAELEALIMGLNLQSRVKLLGWQSDRAALFKAVDCCTFISRDEGFGTVFIQSWMLKTPVIVSEAEGPRQFVKNRETGLLVPIDDVEALTLAIETMYREPALRQAMVEAGYKAYQKDFTKEHCINAYVDFYARCMEKAQIKSVA